MRTRDPYCVENFTYAMSRVPSYANCTQRCGTNWLGLRFKFPIIWFPEKNAKVDISWQKWQRKSVDENWFPSKDTETGKINLNLLLISLTCTEEALIQIHIQTDWSLLHEDIQLYSWGEKLGAKNDPFCFLFPWTFFPIFLYYYNQNGIFSKEKHDYEQV